jgi:hypothetical protein
VRIECDPQPRVEGHRIEMTAAGVAG